MTVNRLVWRRGNCFASMIGHSWKATNRGVSTWVRGVTFACRNARNCPGSDRAVFSCPVATAVANTPMIRPVAPEAIWLNSFQLKWPVSWIQLFFFLITQNHICYVIGFFFRYLIPFWFFSFVHQRTRPFLSGQRERDSRWDRVPTMGRPGAAFAQPSAAQHFSWNARGGKFLPQRGRRRTSSLVLYDGSSGPVATLRHSAMRFVSF